MLPSAQNIDEQLMHRAIALAMHGRGYVEPNPMVGCVIAKQGRIIGEGYHHGFGEPHAEPNALAACIASPAGATAYVTLEPCCHMNKKTPPCVPRLIAAGLARVVIGCLDPNPQVNGRGADHLRSAGIEVSTPVLEAQARQLIAPFFKRVIQKSPYVTMKWAESANGKVAGPGGKTVWITNARSTHIVHELRARCDAILVGINTALSDDPLLAARGVEIRRPLLRAVLDSELRLPITSRLVKTASTSLVVVFCSMKAYETSGTHRVLELEDAGVRVVPLDHIREGEASAQPHPANKVRLGGNLDVLSEGALPQLSLIEMLHHLDGTHLLVEPGPTLARNFLRQGLADRVWIFRSPIKIDQPDAMTAADLNYPATAATQIASDQLTEYLNPDGNSFFALEQSADFTLARGD